MQDAQDAIATTRYWDLVQNISIQPRNIQTPLGMALVWVGVNLRWASEVLLVQRDAGFLTRDARMKERKKYGQRGARARFQFSKR